MTEAPPAPPVAPPTPPPIAPPVAPPSPSPSFINEDFSFADGWQEKLPDDKFGDLKPTLANFKDFPSLAKALKENMTVARSKTEGMVKIPTAPAADAKPEAIEAYKAEVAAYRKATGIPDTAEGYKLTAPEKLPEGAAWNPAHAEAFSKVAHELALTPEQAQKLSEFQVGLTSQQFQANVVELEKYDKAQDAEIMKAFGNQADKRMLQSKQACMTLFGTPELPPDRATLVIGLAKLADLVSEDKLVSIGATTNKLGPEAMAKAIMADPNDAYNKPDHIQHKERAAVVESLMRKAYPG